MHWGHTSVTDECNEGIQGAGVSWSKSPSLSLWSIWSKGKIHFSISSSYTWQLAIHDMSVSLGDINVPSPGLENSGNLLCSTRFTHTMSIIRLAGFQVKRSRSPPPTVKKQIAIADFSTSAIVTTSSLCYRIAGNFRWCKFSHKWLTGIQNKFSYFNFQTHALACCYAPSLSVVFAWGNSGGYHVYKDIWATVVSEKLPCQREDGNRADSFAVAVVRREAIVAHVSKKISSLCSNAGAARSFVE